MAYQPIVSGLSDVRGTHYTQGQDFLYFARNGADAGVYRMPINPARVIATTLAQQATATAHSINLNTTVLSSALATVRQVRWVSNSIRPVSTARIRRWTDPGTFSDITATQLANLDWNAITTDVASTATSPGAIASWPELGTSTTGNIYAVRFFVNGEPRYAKVRVYFEGATRFEWTTYAIEQTPVSVCDLSSSADVRDVILTNFETEMFISGVAGWSTGIHRFINSSTAAGTAPRFITDEEGGYYQPLDPGEATDFQQMALDGGFVYFVGGSHLWRQTIDTAPERMVTLPAGVNGIGLLLESTGEGTWAYIADDHGYVRTVNLSEFIAGAGPLIAPANGEDGAYFVPRPLDEELECGFLSWGNPEHTEILVMDRSYGRALRFHTNDGSFRVSQIDLPTPWSAEAVSADRFFVASETEVGRVDDTILVAGGNRLLGIGLIPFQFIIESVENPNPIPADSHAGLADTSSEPGYYFSQYPNVPFGGNLSLQLNFDGMREDGVHSYTVAFQRRPGVGQPALAPRPITNPFTNLRWDDAASKWVGYQPEMINGRFRVRPEGELRYNPYLAAIIQTNEADSGYNEIIITFYDEFGAVIPLADGDTGRRLIFIDNNRYHTALHLPRLGTPDVAPGPTPSTLECGCLIYSDIGKNDRIAVDFAAWQENAPGTYYLRFYRGGTYLPALEQIAEVSRSATPVYETKSEVAGTPLLVGHLMGNCNVANIRIILSVSSRVIDGFGWVNLSSYSEVSFTMLHSTMEAMHTDWP